MAMVMAVHWDGAEYEVDLETVTPIEYREIKRHLGLKAGAFMNAFAEADEFDADAIVALIWLAQKRANGQAKFLDGEPLMKLMTACAPAAGAEEDAEEPPLGSTPAGT